MRLLPSLAVATCLIVMAVSAEPVQGQLIRINGNGFGGVNIRAPFVRVNTNPYGGTYVRAPFVQVNAPPPAYYQPPYYAPARPVQRYYAPARPVQRYYAPAPGQPYYGTPQAPGAVVQPQQTQPQQMQPQQMQPRFNPIQPQTVNQGQQVNRQPATPNPAVQQNNPSVPVPPPAPEEDNRVNPNQPAPTPQSTQNAKPEMKSVLDRTENPVPQREELPAPKPNPPRKKGDGK